MPVTSAAWARTIIIVVESHANVPSDSGESVGTTYASTSIPVMGTFWVDCADMAAHHHSVLPGPAHAGERQGSDVGVCANPVNGTSTEQIGAGASAPALSRFRSSSGNLFTGHS